MTKIAFLDTETTGLDADLHEIWEVGLITKPYMLEASAEEWRELSWLLPVDLGRADPYALDVGRFHDRHPQGYGTVHSGMELTGLRDFAADFAEWTRGVHLIGANPCFDEERLRKLLRANGACPGWHYHKVDTEAMVLGALAMLHQLDPGKHAAPRLPFKSDDLFTHFGIDLSAFDRHTALGDARLVRAVYERIMGSSETP